MVRSLLATVVVMAPRTNRRVSRRALRRGRRGEDGGAGSVLDQSPGRDVSVFQLWVDLLVRGPNSRQAERSTPDLVESLQCHGPIEWFAEHEEGERAIVHHPT